MQSIRHFKPFQTDIYVHSRNIRVRVGFHFNMFINNFSISPGNSIVSIISWGGRVDTSSTISARIKENSSGPYQFAHSTRALRPAKHSTAAASSGFPPRHNIASSTRRVGHASHVQTVTLAATPPTSFLARCWKAPRSNSAGVLMAARPTQIC